MAERDDTMQPGHGAEGSGVVFVEATMAAAWNVQGEATHALFGNAVRRLFGMALPLAHNTVARSDALTAIWLGPSSWLLVAAGASSLVEYAEKRDALNDVDGALFDVSASRVAWTLAGPRTADVLAKSCPLDFHPRAFAAGTCAQSLIGHVNALFVKHDDTPAFMVIVARSYRRDVWHSLLDAAAQYGAEIRPPAPHR